MTTEHDEGFKAGIEAAAKVADEGAAYESVIEGILALKPAPRSAEHTAEPSAQERERFEALVDKLVSDAYHRDQDGSAGWVERSKVAVLAAYDALATAPSTHKLDEMIEVQRSTCDCVGDNYFRGLINGMILAKSIIEGGDEEPKFVSKPDTAPSPRIEAEPVCPVCGGRPGACRILGHRSENDSPDWQSPDRTPDARSTSGAVACSVCYGSGVSADGKACPFAPHRFAPIRTKRSTSDAAVVLPKLPQSRFTHDKGHREGIWEADQMRVYATAAVLSDRATRSAKLRSTDSSAEAFREAAARDSKIADMASKYTELLYAVEKKHPDESRHETALRYIRAEAAKLTTAPHTADETRVDGKA